MFVTDSGTAIPIANTLDIITNVTAAGTHPIETTGATNVVTTIHAQISQAIAATDATKIGLAAFNSADFTVDANGFVTFTGSGATETLTGNSGGAVGPSAGNINVVGDATTITIAGNPGTHTLTASVTGSVGQKLEIQGVLYLRRQEIGISSAARLSLERPPLKRLELRVLLQLTYKHRRP